MSPRRGSFGARPGLSRPARHLPLARAAVAPSVVHRAGRKAPAANERKASVTTSPASRPSRVLAVLVLAGALSACSRAQDSAGDTGSGATGVAIEPSSAELAPGASVRFAASVGGDPASPVSWTIPDGAGAVSADGVYTAPSTPGVYTVVATSTSDGSLSGSATITVSAAAPDVANVRDFGAAGDGVTDDTAAFRRAAATGKVIVVPRPADHYKITSTIGITNSIRGDGSLPEIRMHGTTGQESSSMLAIIDYAGPGLTVSGLHLDGGWDQSSASGEWAHNVMVKGSRNVTIEDNVLERAEGDNVLLGGEWNPNPSRDIVIRNNQLLTARRCAVALIWANGVTITGNTIQKPSTYVTAIDAEPNPNGYETVWNVTITNNHFDTAAGAVMLYNMPNNAPAGGIGGNFTITGNRGSAAFFFTQVNGGSGWVNVSRSDNF